MNDDDEKRIPIDTSYGRFHVWTKRYGRNDRVKLLLLHGGPGGTHELFQSFLTHLVNEGFEFYYYDQLGSFHSDQPTNTNLWTIERFVDEVEQVRQALGLNKTNFYLLGHSWGGLLALEYALTYPTHLKGLIISNMMSSCPAYGLYAQTTLATQMDSTVLKSLREFEANNDQKNPAYMNLLMPNFYHKHFCRLNPWPDIFSRAMEHLNDDVYTLMQGPSEFGISGRIKDWNRSDDLSTINVPTLVIGARFDTMDPEYLQWMAKQMPHGTSVICPHGSHCSMWDDQEHYFPGLINFIRHVEQ
jgi:proline iminopeptidase